MNSEHEDEIEKIAEAELLAPAPEQTEGSQPEIVQAEFITGAPDAAAPIKVQPVPMSPAYSHLPRLENIQAKGGAVGAIVLGTLAIAGSFLTGYSAINAVIGLLMGLWGLSSPKPKLALIGLVLCIVGGFLSILDVSSALAWLNSPEPAEF